MADQTPYNPTAFGNALLAINFIDPEKKKDKEYGRKVISEIYRQQNGAGPEFFRGRNIQWGENDSWASGRTNMNEFIDFVSTEGNKAYTPVDMTPPGLGPQFVGTLVDSMSQNEEYPCVKAIDDGSISEKLQRKLEALFRMQESDSINEMQMQAGIQLEPADAYVPDDPLSAEIYFKLEDRLPKEIEFEEKLSKIMSDNQYDQKSRKTKWDLIVYNCAAVKVERSSNGFIEIRKCNAPNLIFNFTTSASGQLELSYIGEIYSLKIKDLRKKWGKSDTNPKGLTEKEIFDMASTANRYNIANRFWFNWTDSYVYSQDRPYDDYGIEVFDCEIQSFDADYYVSKTDAFGKEKIQPKNGIPQPTSEKAKVIQANKLTVYRGVWAIKSDKMIYWGLPDLVIKPFMNIAESLFSYSIQVPNNDGRYSRSLFERGLGALRKWTLADLKVKQLIANLRPSGIAFDIEQMRDLDLGLGNITSPMEILKIYNQTGNVPFSSIGVRPDKEQGIPIHEMANAGSVAQLQELQVILDAAKQELRELWGVPLYRDGGDVGDRTSGVLQSQQNLASNNVTDFINFSDKSLWDEALYKCVLINWDDVVLKQGRTELMDTIFQVEVKLKPSAYEKAQLEENIKIGMQTIDPSTGKPLLTFKDAFKIRNIENYKLAEMYLANTEDQNERKNQEDKSKREDANIKSQQESAAQTAEAEAQNQAEKMRLEKEMLMLKSTEEQKLKVLEIYGQTVSKGLQPTPFMEGVLQQLFPNIVIPTSMQNKTYEKAAGVQDQQLSQPQMQEPAAQESVEQPQEPQEQEMAEQPMQ